VRVPRQGIPAGEYLREREVSSEELAGAVASVGDFGGDNRAGIQGTLHRWVASGCAGRCTASRWRALLLWATGQVRI
jgi:hypothetical protein